MRLLILWPDRQSAEVIRSQMEARGWDVDLRLDGRTLLPWDHTYDVLLLHLCLSGLDGLSSGDALAASWPIRPPRILFAAPLEWCVHRPLWADCTVGTGGDPNRLCDLIDLLALKPLPRLAMQQRKPLEKQIERFLDDLSLKKHLKGRAYAAWLLGRIVPSTAVDAPPLGALYRECARMFDTSSAAVERCLRVAVESVFTQGSLHSIERFFGETVDPERGKPTNRAFLLQVAQQLRYSLTASRAPNSSEMHHRPAAPTSV